MSGWIMRVMVTHSKAKRWVKVTLPGRSPVAEIYRVPFRAVALFAGEGSLRQVPGNVCFGLGRQAGG
jgi:hypothetical protein